MLHIIWIGILLGIGFMLAPLVLRLAIWAVLFAIVVAMGLAILVLIVDYPEILRFLASFGLTLVGILIVAEIVSIVAAKSREHRQREQDIQAMRHHFAEEMEIRLRNEGYYLPPRQGER